MVAEYLTPERFPTTRDPERYPTTRDPERCPTTRDPELSVVIITSFPNLRCNGAGLFHLLSRTLPVVVVLAGISPYPVVQYGPSPSQLVSACCHRPVH